MYEVFDHLCAYVKLFIVWLLIAFNLIYCYDVLYIPCQCAIRIYESEISYVCIIYVGMSPLTAQHCPLNLRIVWSPQQITFVRTLMGTSWWNTVKRIP